MANDVVIRADGLGKSYLIGHDIQERNTTLRDALARSVRRLARGAMDIANGRPVVAGDSIEEFWALKDVNFEIRRGDVVGIIGRNGAGKSTLLKILSRITEPSRGRVEIKGRVASLLEVGTGFHPELTGRENVFLNGAILGMSRDEIRSKFDEIVAFAEVERFLDTPVKRYSSGMYVRLAFAVAAHLDPEILIVDEVLAVGDAEFQKKCLGKMQDVAGGGRTVIFVSHNMSVINSLCQTAVLMKAGRVDLQGATRQVSAAYSANSELVSSFSQRARPKGASHWFESVGVTVDGARIRLALGIRAESSKAMIINLHLRDAAGNAIGMGSLGGFAPEKIAKLSTPMTELEIGLALPVLANGTYQISLDLEEPYGQFVDRLVDRLSFEILRDPIGAHGRSLDISWGAGAIQLEADLIPGSLNDARPRFG